MWLNIKLFKNVYLKHSNIKCCLIIFHIQFVFERHTTVIILFTWLPLVNYSWIYHTSKESRLKATFPNFHLHSEAHNSVSFCRVVEAECWLEIYRIVEGRNLEALVKHQYIRNETARNIWKNSLLSFAVYILIIPHFFTNRFYFNFKFFSHYVN